MDSFVQMVEFSSFFVIYFIPQNSEYEFDEDLKMKFKNPMLVVADIDQTVEFYRKVLGLV